MAEPSELSRRRQAEARRVAESKATIPHLQLRGAVEVDADLERIALEASVVSACAAALRRHPLLNASYRDGKVEEHSRVNVAVAMDAPDGPLLPAIVDADAKAPDQIGAELEQLRDQARSGDLGPSQLSGATFTVTFLASTGASDFEAVIVPPQAGILAIGSPQQRPVVRDGSVVPASLMSLTLGCDARIVSAADGADFLAGLRAELEG